MAKRPEKRPNNIRVCRKAVKPKMSQDDLAEAIGVSQPTVAKYERGDIDPPMSQARKMAKVLGCSIDDLDIRIDGAGLDMPGQIAAESRDLDEGSQIELLSIAKLFRGRPKKP